MWNNIAAVMLMMMMMMMMMILMTMMMMMIDRYVIYWIGRIISENQDTGFKHTIAGVMRALIYVHMAVFPRAGMLMCTKQPIAVSVPGRWQPLRKSPIGQQRTEALSSVTCPSRTRLQLQPQSCFSTAVKTHKVNHHNTHTHTHTRTIKAPENPASKSKITRDLGFCFARHSWIKGSRWPFKKKRSVALQSPPDLPQPA